MSNLPGSVDDLTIVAPIAGMYQIEVHGFSAAEYRLIVEIKTAGEIEVAQISGGVDPNKQTPAQPPVANNSTPLPVAIDSPGIGQQTVFLPLVRR